jgi:preprotein translocase subunit SecG
MQSFLVVVQILIGASMIGVILVQHGKGADAGAAFGSGASSTVFGARGSATFLTKLTAVFAVLFLSNSLLLGALSSGAPEPKSLMEREQQEEGSGATGVLESTIKPLDEGGGEGASSVAPQESDLPEVPGVQPGAEDDAPPILNEERQSTPVPSEQTGPGMDGAEPAEKAPTGASEVVPSPPGDESESRPPSKAEGTVEPGSGVGGDGKREDKKESGGPPAVPSRPAPKAEDAPPAEKAGKKVQ